MGTEEGRGFNHKTRKGRKRGTVRGSFWTELTELSKFALCALGVFAVKNRSRSWRKPGMFAGRRKFYSPYILLTVARIF
jgi:hypothetical protein